MFSNLKEENDVGEKSPTSFIIEPLNQSSRSDRKKDAEKHPFFVWLKKPLFKEEVLVIKESLKTNYD